MGASTQSALEAFRAGKIGLAERLCRDSLRFDAGNVAAGTLLGEILLKTGRLDEADAVLRDTTSVDPSAIEALLWHSTVLRRLGRLEDAAEAARRAIELDPANADAHSKLGQIYLHQQRFEDARDAFEASIRHSPLVASPHNNLGIALTKLGLIQQAEDEFRRAIAIDEGFVPSTLSLIGLLLSGRRFGEAVAIAKQGLRSHPNDVDLHLRCAEALAAGADGPPSTVDLEDARHHLRRCIELQPGHSLAYARLGMIEQGLGNFEEADRLFASSIRLNPMQGQSYLGLSRARVFTKSDRILMGQMDAAANNSSLPEQALLEVHYALGKAHDDLGEHEVAMRHFDVANRNARTVFLRDRPFDREAYGTFVESITKSFTSDVLARVQHGQYGHPTPILIVGSMRSGTTLLEQILSAHPDVTGCGELRFWNARGLSVYAAAEPPSPEAIADLSRDYRAFVQGIAGAGARYTTDKMPENYEQIGLFHMAFPQAPIIYMRRNAVDSCLSIYMTPNFTPPDYGCDKESITFVYEQHLKLMDHWRRALPAGRIFEIRYEHLVENPEPILRDLIAYCGIGWDDACLRHHENRRFVRTPSYWQVRQPIYKSSVGRRQAYRPWLGAFARLIAFD